jgi:PmbA protein
MNNAGTGTATTDSPENIDLDLDIGRKIIKLAESLGAAETEVFMIKMRGTDFSIEKNIVNFASSSTEFGMGVRVIKDKRLGFGYCTEIANAEKAISNAINTTKLRSPQDLEFISKAPTQEIPSTFDRNILELSIEDGLEYTKRLISGCKEMDPRIIITGGGVGYGGGSIGLVTSTGVEIEHRSTGIAGGVSTILKDKSVSTGFEYAHSRQNDIDYAKLGKTATELALSGQNPTQVEPGDYKVMFTPEAISELIEFTIIPALYGEQAKKGETFYSNKIGEQVAAEFMNICDDGTLENGINTAPWDDEGEETKTTVLVEDGCLKGYLFDRSSAAEFNEKSTGNAMRTSGMSGGRSYKAEPKTKVQNFTITSPGKPRDDLISEVENGLIIYELLGAHTANQASGNFSVNSPMLFKIKDGAIESAGKQVMISGNMNQMMNKIVALGSDFKNMSGGLSPVWVISCCIPYT